jgi:pimeloyl-ACP methyl ester carboxylesterase
VVLLHGFMGSGNYWGGAYDGLAAGGPVVVPDLLGFGRSPKPASGYDADHQAAALLALLDELGIHEPAVVAGHSFGGLIALRFADLHPERVRAVVLFGPTLFPDAATARRRVAAMDHLGGLLTLDTPVARSLCMWFHDHRRASAALTRLLRPELPRPVVRDAAAHTWASYWGTMEQVILAAQGESWLAETRAPVRLVVGRHDGVADVAYLEALVAGHPGASLRWVDGGGHDLPLTAPRLCVEEIEAVRTPGHFPGRRGGGPSSSASRIGQSLGDGPIFMVRRQGLTGHPATPCEAPL